MGYGGDKVWQMRRAGQQASARKRLRDWLEAADGDIAFKVVVMTAGMLSSVAIAFGFLSS